MSRRPNAFTELAGIALGLMSVSFTVIIFNLIFGESRTLRRRIKL